MKKLAGTLAFAIVLLVCALMASLPVAADPLPAGVSDQLTVYSLRAPGAPYAQITLNEDGTTSFSGNTDDVGCYDGSTIFACSTAPQAENQNYIYFIANVDLVGSTDILGTTVLCESSPCNDSSANYSDVFGVYDLPEYGTVIAFSSDTEGETPNVSAFLNGIGSAPVTYQVETGDPVNATYQDAAFARLYNVTFQSDAEATSVPEPGTLPLLGAGLLGLVLAGSLKRKPVGSVSA